MLRNLDGFGVINDFQTGGRSNEYLSDHGVLISSIMGWDYLSEIPAVCCFKC